MTALARLALASSAVLAALALGGPAVAAPPTAPELIERAVEAGTLDFSTGQLYTAYSMFAWERLPQAYRSPAPFDGTLPLLRLRQNLASVTGAARLELAALIGTGPTDPGTSVCELSPLPNTSTLETDHYWIEYNAAEVDGGPDGLDIAFYAQSLETSWVTEVDRFGWPAPPVALANPAPGNKYLVKVQQLSPVLYGYVSNVGTGAGRVGDNPNTPWNDVDADASCMGLNSDYNFFPGSPGRALDATTAHEFNHSIQFGYGALSGPNAPDSAFVEGGATWMEDEVFDYANDNYNYLWPDFHDDMGEHEGSPYSYWVTWRGITERYGASRPNAGENVMQAFWELTSRNTGNSLQALDAVLRTRGTTLPEAYHAYAIAAGFTRTCGGGYALPYCFEEADGYVNGDGTQPGAGPTSPHGGAYYPGDEHVDLLPDNYALHWVVLPRQGVGFKVHFANTSTGGLFRVSTVCDTGSKLVITSFGTVAPGGVVTKSMKSTLGCQEHQAVITNVAQTAANPEASEPQAYRIWAS